MTRPVRVVAQVSLAEGSKGRDEIARVLTEEGAGAVGASRSHAGIHLELSVGGGDLTWDLLFEEASAVDALRERVADVPPEAVARELGGALAGASDRITSIELVTPEEIGRATGWPGLVGIKRTLWLRVEPGTDAEAIARFEAETPLLAAAVPAIRNWRWSRVPAWGTGAMATRWTHLWEQEFERVDGLQVDYMSSPVHWGFIDRWFDAEMPERIVDLRLAHLACPETAPVLSWDG